MAVRLHVTGTIRYGGLNAFIAAAQEFAEYRRKKGYSVPGIFVGLSGGMNTVLMVFDYASAAQWEREEAAVNGDPEYGRVAAQMPYAEGSIHYALFQPLEDVTAARAGA